MGQWAIAHLSEKGHSLKATTALLVMHTPRLWKSYSLLTTLPLFPKWSVYTLTAIHAETGSI